jgi:hypothetical protein
VPLIGIILTFAFLLSEAVLVPMAWVLRKAGERRVAWMAVLIAELVLIGYVTSVNGPIFHSLPITWRLVPAYVISLVFAITMVIGIVDIRRS